MEGIRQSHVRIPPFLFADRRGEPLEGGLSRAVEPPHGKEAAQGKSQWCLGWLAAFTLVVMADDATAFDFSAERIVKSGKKVVTAHVNAKDDRWRFEFAQPQGGASIIIVRMDLHSSMCERDWLVRSIILAGRT